MGEEFESVTTQLDHAPHPLPRVTSDNMYLYFELLDAPHNDPAWLYEALRAPIRIPW